MAFLVYVAEYGLARMEAGTTDGPLPSHGSDDARMIADVRDEAVQEQLRLFCIANLPTSYLQGTVCLTDDSMVAL